VRWKHLFLVPVAFGVLSSCGGPSPTAPSVSATNVVVTGPQVLRIVNQSPCTQLGQGVLPLVYTRVSVTRSSNEWVATADDPAAGDIQIRFRQSGEIVIPGSIPVTGTMTGTAVHLPELFSGPAWDIRATFGGPASLTGTAFAAGAFGTTASGIDGVGGGSLTLTDATGNTCTGTTFSWSIFPLP
jgi:hypothetical protein